MLTNCTAARIIPDEGDNADDKFVYEWETETETEQQQQQYESHIERERERELRYNAVDKQTNNITTTTATTEKIDRTVRAVVRNVVFVLFGSLFFFITILCDTRFTAEVS